MLDMKAREEEAMKRLRGEKLEGKQKYWIWKGRDGWREGWEAFTMGGGKWERVECPWWAQRQDLPPPPEDDEVEVPGDVILLNNPSTTTTQTRNANQNKIIHYIREC